jgi:hypothetical protein
LISDFTFGAIDMKKINLKNNLSLILVFYIIVISFLLVRIALLSYKTNGVPTATNTIQLNTEKIKAVSGKVKDRSDNNFPGKPDITQFIFGKIEPFQ